MNVETQADGRRVGDADPNYLLEQLSSESEKTCNFSSVRSRHTDTLLQDASN